ncbi:MAG: hypothetical protein IKJ35_03105 [Clostridia bacterium]|nr:hypothetical protein [Clostridia bacterium]
MDRCHHRQILSRGLTAAFIFAFFMFFFARPAVSALESSALLPQTADAGETYVDSMIFFGESTTSHLRSRGVLRDGTKTNAVWSDASGTRMLSSKMLSQPIVYPPTGELLTPVEACERAKPRYLVLSFGQNGLVRFAEDTDTYVTCYKRLIDALLAASPDTKIILQTVYPLGAQGNYSADLATLNQFINRLNACLPEIAADYTNVRVADTASVLRDADGKLCASFDNGDGQHLNAEAYQTILSYLRTHAWQAEDESASVERSQT